MKKILMLILLYANIFAAGHVGDSVKSFELPDLYQLDKTISFDEYKGRVVLLNLWASWCSGCQEEMPLFVKLQEEYQGKDFTILLSSIDKDPNNSIEFLQSVDAKRVLKSLYDKDKILPKEYRCAGMPSSYLIDRDGKIVDVFIGSIHKDKMLQLKAKIDALMEK
ncbi:MAG: TlpA disulfide reductase family protein [Sulfurimonas sp.]|nr:TlpA disulfide reductase family protein [Sulfurimonas sp.]